MLHLELRMKDKKQKYIIPSCDVRDAKRHFAEIDYRNFLNSLPDIVYKIDPDGCFIYVNNAVQSLGYSPDELIGKHFSHIMHPDDIPNISREKVLSEFANNPSNRKCPPKLFDERRTGERMTRNLEVRLLKKGVKEGLDASVYAFGDIRYIDHFNAVPDRKTIKFTGTIGVIRDITERKQMEKELHRLSGRLLTAKEDERKRIAVKLLRAINAAEFIVPSIAANMLQYRPQEAAPLTAREKEVLILIASGNTNREIAKRLSISVKTVETHRARIMKKLSIHKAADLVRYAIKSKLVEG
mgnify:CR=1 FL=1